MVISRNESESFTLERNGELLATITITEYRRRQVRVGIEAPKDIIIMRSEIRPVTAATVEVARP